VARPISDAPDAHGGLTTLKSSYGRFEHGLHESLVWHPGSLRLPLEPLKQIAWNTKRDGDCPRSLGQQGLDVFVELLV
jgi:hypothetical protein